MAYKALYRTYRPQKFSEIVGQETIVRTLQNSIRNNKISHAYLFCGPRGTGKTTVARIFAKALNCKCTNEFEPCNECTNCNEITNGVSPDVIEVDAASNNGVDEIRELKDKVKFLPASSKYKVYIIDEVHMLSTSAFNALLKTLEEPPSHAIFILATTEPHKVLPTIVSRCQRYDFKAFSVLEILENLKHVCENEHIQYEEEALKTIAVASDGGMRDALSYLDQAISLSDEVITSIIGSDVTGLVDKENLFQLALNLENKKITESLQLVNNLQNNGREISKIIIGLLELYRDILLYKATSDYTFNDKYLEFANNIDTRKVYYNIDILNEIQNKIKATQTPQIYLEVGIIKMINSSKEELDYNKRIIELEEKINNIDQISINPSSDNVDSKRIRLLEEKFNNLLTELSKLELPKIVEKVKMLEVVELPKDQVNLKEIVSRLDKTIEDLELLKVVQNGLRNEVDNISSGGVDTDALNDIVEESVKKYKPTINYTEIEAFVKRTLDSYEEKLEKIYSSKNQQAPTIDCDLIEKLKDLETIVNNLKNDLINKNPEDTNNNEDKYVDTYNELFNRIDYLEQSFSNLLNQKQENVNYEQLIDNKIRLLENNNKVQLQAPDKDIERRIEKIESNVYKIMSNTLSQSQSKKNKNKISEKQISLWRDDIMDVDKINNFYDNDKVDFGSLTNTITDDGKDKVSIVNEENNIVNQELESPIVIDEEVSDVHNNYADNSKDEILNQIDVINENDPNSIEKQKDFNLFEVMENQAELQGTEEITIDEEGTFEEGLHEYYDDNVEDNHNGSSSNVEPLNETNLFVGESKDEFNEKYLEENDFFDYEKENKIKLEEERKERMLLEEKKRLMKVEEEKRILEEKRASEEKRILEEKRASEEKDINNDLDEYERYDVKVLERIMNDSRNPEFVTEKGRITSLWKHLVSLAPIEKRGVAEMLTEGQITAVGNHEFVLIYQSSSTCNQVMGRNFKRSSLKLLFDLLDGDYNYFAITQEVWMIKRREYADQYSVGTKYPTLTPINDPSLKVVIDNFENEEDKMYKKVVDIFGPNINIKKRS